MPRSNKTPISKAKKFEQQQMERMLLLKKPLELISSDVNVPGKFWEGATINRKVYQPCAPQRCRTLPLRVSTVYGC